MSLVRPDERGGRPGSSASAPGSVPRQDRVAGHLLAGRLSSADDPGAPQGEHGRPGDAPTRLPSRRLLSGSTASSAVAMNPRRSPWSRSARRSRLSWSIQDGRLVDASAGTRGPIGLRSGWCLGRRDRLLAVAALEARPLPGRPGRPGSTRPRGVSRITDPARGRHCRPSHRFQGSTSQVAVWTGPMLPSSRSRRFLSSEKRWRFLLSPAPGSSRPHRGQPSWRTASPVVRSPGSSNRSRSTKRVARSGRRSPGPR